MTGLGHSSGGQANERNRVAPCNGPLHSQAAKEKEELRIRIGNIANGLVGYWPPIWGEGERTTETQCPSTVGGHKLVDSSSVARLQAESRGSRVDDFVESNESSAKRLDAASGEEPKQQALPVPAPSLPFIPPCSLGRYHALPGRVLGGPKQGPRRRAQGFVFPGSQSRPQRSQPATACEVCACAWVEEWECVLGEICGVGPTEHTQLELGRTSESER